MQTETKNCKKCKHAFELDQDDFSFYEKMKVPAPEVCPECRFKMRALWRNEMTLYSGIKCFNCHKGILSIYNHALLYTIFCYDCYTKDFWDAKSLGLVYNFSDSFISQFNNLILKVPKKNLFIDSSSGPIVNTEYANMAGGMRDCYMVFNGGIGENMFYTRGARKCQEVSDLYFCENLDRCYECINSHKSSMVIFGSNITNCVDCMFIKNCSGLTNCFGCVNLRNKSYYWFNEQLTRNEYFNRLNQIRGNYKELFKYDKKFKEFCLEFPNRENNNIKNSSSLGDYLFECKNVQNSFEVMGAENSKYLFSARNSKESFDIIGFGANSELLLECIAVGFSSYVIGGCSINNSQNIFYSINLINCYECIGCDGLKNASYCILNKQYEKEEYEKLKEHIIKELIDQGVYGLMIPPELSPFAYNETIAQDNMPLKKEEALSQGFRWEDNIQKTEGKETLQPEDIPDHIKDIEDSITSEILKCAECNRNYKIIEQELLFYRKMILPIPRKCFFCRHKDRIIKRGLFKFFKRDCDNCGKETHTNLTKEVAPIMYCEQCYQQEVI